MRSKLKLKLAVLKEQERLLQEKGRAADAAERRRSELEEEIKRLSSANTKLTAHRDESHGRLQEAKEALVKNQQVRPRSAIPRPPRRHCASRPLCHAASPSRRVRLGRLVRLLRLSAPPAWHRPMAFGRRPRR